jgi:hypothetical protein
VERDLITSRKLIVFATVTFFSIIILPSSVLADQNEAAAAIASAKQQIVGCYQAAREAESAGANVTSLTAVLDDAGVLLSNSELAYSKDDFDTALSLAVQSRESLSNFVPQANTLKESAIQQRNLDFMVNIVGSVVGTFGVLGAGAAIWFLLKRRNAQTGEQPNESPTA